MLLCIAQVIRSCTKKTKKKRQEIGCFLLLYEFSEVEACFVVFPFSHKVIRKIVKSFNRIIEHFRSSVRQFYKYYTKMR